MLIKAAPHCRRPAVRRPEGQSRRRRRYNRDVNDVALPVGAAPVGVGVFDLTPDALKEVLSGWNEPAYRADQILAWVYRRDADDYDAMSNLPGPLRAKLGASLPIYRSQVLARRVAADGTTKLLLGWPDGATSECVCIPDSDRRTACVSTQVGCPVGCLFCASGLDGLQRQLSCGEIVEQAMRVRQVCGDARLSNVVFMGLGEPLHNYHATVAAVRTLNAAWGVGIGARKITVSTVGLPKAIRQLAEEGLQIKLAVSLHAPNDELRRQIIPWAEAIDIASLVEAARVYFEKTTREVTLEYVLLGGLNDAPQHARELAQVAKGMRSNVNLIRYNPVESLPFQRPDAAAAERFMAILRAEGVNTHLRRSRGIDVDAACGQLRRRSATMGAVVSRRSG
ncbi:MAG: 23S rRNA (adenine(2503)-C(2))-methyltransferase RlmN [Phycisphaerales bacterium]|nr:MAG: 23S rRNA (adenine(2503)-C(2))-methyltransferase RlmN [Phycisphaerales bacterium]